METEIWIKEFVFVSGDSSLIRKVSQTNYGAVYRIRRICKYRSFLVHNDSEIAYYKVELYCKNEREDRLYRVCIALSKNQWELRLNDELCHCSQTGSTALCLDIACESAENISESIKNDPSNPSKLLKGKIYKL